MNKRLYMLLCFSVRSSMSAARQPRLQPPVRQKLLNPFSTHKASLDSWLQWRIFRTGRKFSIAKSSRQKIGSKQVRYSSHSSLPTEIQRFQNTKPYCLLRVRIGVICALSNVRTCRFNNEISETVPESWRRMKNGKCKSEHFPSFEYTTVPNYELQRHFLMHTAKLKLVTAS